MANKKSMKSERRKVWDQVRGKVLNPGKNKVWDLSSSSVIYRVWNKVRNPAINQITDQIKNQLCVQVKQNKKL
jgi:hypothetical protein